MRIFPLILAIGSIGGIALGGDPRVSIGLWFALVASFVLGHWVGHSIGFEDGETFATTGEPEPSYIEVRTTACHAGSDGDCSWSECPQLRDREPVATGRHCPLDGVPVKPWAPLLQAHLADEAATPGRDFLGPGLDR